jgi:hypothetical protein
MIEPESQRMVKVAVGGDYLFWLFLTDSCRKLFQPEIRAFFPAPWRGRG